MNSSAPCNDALPGDLARAIITERWPDVARRLATVELFSAIALDTSGPVQTLAADGIRLASAWEPDAEAALQLAHLPATCDEITLYGVGMGSLPELLLQRLSPDGVLTVVLMNVSLFATMLDLIEQSGWLQHPSLELVLASEQSAVSQPHAITTPLLMLAEPAAALLRDQLLQTLTDVHARRHLSTREALTLANMAANEAILETDPDVSALYTGNNASVVVAGAGPSLDLALRRIGELQADGTAVVCVDAALRPLLQAGIRPDCVVTLDPQPAVMRFFEIDLATLASTALVYFPHVDSKVIQRWPWHRYVAYTRHERYDSLRENIPHTSLFTSGSVIHPATDLAVRMGATTVYLAGADFGFPTDATHAGTSAFCRAAPATNASGLTVTNYAGQNVPTMMSFLSYYRDLEAFIDSNLCKGRNFVNLGDISARMRGVSSEALA